MLGTPFTGWNKFFSFNIFSVLERCNRLRLAHAHARTSKQTHISSHSLSLSSPLLTLLWLSSLDEFFLTAPLLTKYYLCYLVCCIFWPAIGCCTLQTLVKILIFNAYRCWKPKKRRKSKQIAANFCQKTFFFKFAPKPWLKVLFPEKFMDNFSRRLYSSL